MNRNLHLFAGVVTASPDHAKTRFAPSVKDANHISGPQINVETGEECPALADVAGTCLLQEALASDIDPPNRKWNIAGSARLTTSLYIAKDTHMVFTVAAPEWRGKITALSAVQRSLQRIPISGISRNAILDLGVPDSPMLSREAV